MEPVSFLHQTTPDPRIWAVENGTGTIRDA